MAQKLLVVAIRCQIDGHVSPCSLRQQDQLTILLLLVSQFGTWAPKIECRGELVWKGLIPLSKQGEPFAQDFIQSRCEFILRMETLLILWVSGPEIGIKIMIKN